MVFSADLRIFLIIANIWIGIVHSDPRAIIYKGKVNIGLLIGAHSSTSTQSLCDSISVNGLHNSMANVWSLHMYNKRQRVNSFDEIGVYIYDTCSNGKVAQRQTVRLISHLFSVGQRICREAKAYPPLIGVIFDGQTYDTSVDILKSFNVPIITTSDERLSDHNSTNVFSVAPSLKYLSKAVISLVKELNLQSIALVVSEEEPMFDRKYINSLPLISQTDFTIDTNYNDLNPNEGTYDSLQTEKTITEFRGKRYRRRDDIFSSNTVFYLSSSEAMDLLNSLSGTGPTGADYEMAANYSYIIVTTSDISLQMKTSNDFNRKEKLRKNVFLISPLIEKTNEYQNYFETTVNAGTKGDHPLVAEYKRANEAQVPNMSVAVMTKAVWALTQTYQHLYQKQCAGNKLNCNLSTNNNLTQKMTKGLKSLNTIISDSGLKELNGVKLSFDSENKLNSWKYQIMIVSSNWQTINLGFYSADIGLSIDSKFMKTILTNRRNKFKNRPKSMVKVLTNTLTPLSSNNLPLFKQAVYSLSNNSVGPSNLMRSSIRHQMFASSAPVDDNNDSEDQNSSTRQPINDSNHVSKRRYNGLTSWLGTVWSMAILSTSILGILITLYVQTFLLMKSCEGALRKANQALVICHLIAVTITFLGSSLFVFYPNPMICCLRHTIHNFSVSLLFGSLLIKAMHIRAQKSIGLGGRASRVNQFLTLLFIVGIQTALEFQKWRYEFSSESVADLNQLCLKDGNQFMRSQIYISIILSLLLLMCWSARNTPFNQRDGNQLLVVSLLIAIIFIVSVLLIMNLNNKSKYSDIVVSISMNSYAFVVLLGLFIPLLNTIHKYGVLVPKSGSYADSLSTIFTNFGGSHDLADNFSHNSSKSHNKECLNTKMSKSFDFQNTNNFFARVSPNCYSNPIANQHKFNRNLMPNTLYEGVPGFRSAYP